MDLSNELVIIFAAIGAVIFLFLMDYYYRTLEGRAGEERLEAEQTIIDPLDSKERAMSAGSETETDEPNIAA